MMSNPGQKDYESGTWPGHLGCVYSVYSLSLPWDEKCCVCNDIRANPYVHKAIFFYLLLFVVVFFLGGRGRGRVLEG